MKTRTNQPVYKDDGTLLKDTDLGDKLPVIEEGDAGKVLMVNEDEDGYELGTPSGGTKLYKHTITGMGGAFQGLTLEIISLNSQPYNNFQSFLDAVASHLDIRTTGDVKVRMIYSAFSGSSFKVYFGGYYYDYAGSSAPELLTYELGVSDITPADVVTEL